MTVRPRRDADTDQDGMADLVLRLDNGVWKREDAKGRKMLDAALFTNAAMRERFEKIVAKIQPADKKAERAGGQ